MHNLNFLAGNSVWTIDYQKGSQYTRKKISGNVHVQLLGEEMWAGRVRSVSQKRSRCRQGQHRVWAGGVLWTQITPRAPKLTWDSPGDAPALPMPAPCSGSDSETRGYHWAAAFLRSSTEGSDSHKNLRTTNLD